MIDYSELDPGRNRGQGFAKTATGLQCHTAFLGVTLKCYKVATGDNRAEESEKGKSHVSPSNLNYFILVSCQLRSCYCRGGKGQSFQSSDFSVFFIQRRKLSKTKPSASHIAGTSV